jgi:hypothetical protein
MTLTTDITPLGRSRYAASEVDSLPQLFDGLFKLVREGLGLEAFGVQIMELPPNYETAPHDERDTDQQELYVGLRGSGAVIVHGATGDEHVPIDADRLVALGPHVDRTLSAGPDGLRVLCVGAPIEQAYNPPDWTSG